MKYGDLLKELNNSSPNIKIDTFEHSFNPRQIFASLKHKVEFELSVYKRRNKKTEIKKIIPFNSCNCFNCAKYFSFEYDPSKNKIVPILLSGDFTELKSEKCTFTGNKLLVKEVEVNFPTGNFIFSNHFGDLSDFDEYSHEDGDYYNICYHSGRLNTMKYLAKEKNIAYGQLGNTAYSVYKVSNNRILLTETDSEDNKFPDEWEFQGQISCGVWRFEAIDLSYLKEANPKIKLKFPSKKDLKNHFYSDHVKVKANKGVWILSHYYDSVKRRYENGIEIFAEFNLSRKHKIDNLNI